MTDPSPDASRASATAFGQVAGAYAATFAVLGLYMAFFPVWLRDVGELDYVEITTVSSGLVVARTIAGPLWAQRVDTTQRPRRVLMPSGPRGMTTCICTPSRTMLTTTFSPV